MIADGGTIIGGEVARDSCYGIGYEDRPWINARIAELNKLIRERAIANGAEYVDVFDAFDGHELCNVNGNNEWMNGLDASGRSFSFHPNEQGQAAFAERVQLAMDTVPSYLLPNPARSKVLEKARL